MSLKAISLCVAHSTITWHSDVFHGWTIRPQHTHVDPDTVLVYFPNTGVLHRYCILCLENTGVLHIYWHIEHTGVLHRAHICLSYTHLPVLMNRWMHRITEIPEAILTAVIDCPQRTAQVENYGWPCGVIKVWQQTTAGGASSKCGAWPFRTGDRIPARYWLHTGISHGSTSSCV